MEARSVRLVPGISVPCIASAAGNYKSVDSYESVGVSARKSYYATKVNVSHNLRQEGKK